jgi:2-polyprenyl-3-methyl-5-hydroxy-6-metoxy-1,4-benzoquinol methylase
MTPSNCIEINRQSWNHRTETHVQSAFYDNESFLQGKNTLNEIELQLLGDIKGKSILHLQCHFGQDTISLSRLGAIVTGIDLSDKAIEKAKRFATQTGSSALFVAISTICPNTLTSCLILFSPVMVPLGGYQIWINGQN